MTRSPKYSFIIPVFNARDFLRTCLDSILAQDHKDWEAILVDDGSTDGGADILREYQAKDLRFVVISVKNQGCGLARNCGIKAAQGEWIAFVDADDHITKDYLTEIDKVCGNNDVVFFDAARVDEKGKILRTYRQHRFRDLSHDDLIRVQTTGKMEWGAWIKCVRISLIRDNQIEFPACKNAEDAVYSFRMLSRARTFTFIPKVLYHYVDHHVTSLSSLPMIDPWGEALVMIKEDAAKNGMLERYASTLNAFRLTVAVVSIDRINRYASSVDRKDRIRGLMNQLKAEMDLSYGVDLKHMMFKAWIFVPFLIRGISWPVTMVSVIRMRIRRFLQIIYISI